MPFPIINTQALGIHKSGYKTVSWQKNETLIPNISSMGRMYLFIILFVFSAVYSLIRRRPQHWRDITWQCPEETLDHPQATATTFDLGLKKLNTLESVISHLEISILLSRN